MSKYIYTINCYRKKKKDTEKWSSLVLNSTAIQQLSLIFFLHFLLQAFLTKYVHLPFCICLCFLPRRPVDACFFQLSAALNPARSISGGSYCSPGWHPILSKPGHGIGGWHFGNGTVVIKCKTGKKKSHVKTTGADRSHTFIRVFWTNVFLGEKALAKETSGCPIFNPEQ